MQKVFAKYSYWMTEVWQQVCTQQKAINYSVTLFNLRLQTTQKTTQKFTIHTIAAAVHYIFVSFDVYLLAKSC